MTLATKFMSNVHIAHIDFPAFYAYLFPSLGAAEDFYSKVKDLPPGKNAATLVFHQAARMVWLADQIETVARGRPAFQILFYFIAAELIAKITFGFKGQGQSERYVQRFFCEICSDQTKVRLGDSFERMPYGVVTPEQAVHLLYKIRCDVVHEGMYYGFQLRLEKQDLPEAIQIEGTSFTTSLTVMEIRRMVLEGAVSATKKLLNETCADAPST